MKKILVIGSGQFAFNWLKNTQHKYENYTASKNLKPSLNNKFYRVDATNIKEITLVANEIKPDYILNAAALSDVEKCELDPDLAKRTNSIIPSNLAKISNSLKIKLIHLSTDHFDNYSEQKRDEFVNPIPVNVYGRTKIDGEQEIIKYTENYLILRTNFFSYLPLDRTTFFNKLVKDLYKNKYYFGAIDYFFNPVDINFLIAVMDRLIESDFKGLLNITSDKCRPNNLCLANDKLKNIIGVNKIDFEEQIKKNYKQLMI
jgi:dTDP-4-dehydrorhamnose reductase